MKAHHIFSLKFIYSEKATKFCEIFTLLLSYVVSVKSKVKISQNFVAFSEYMNFTCNVVYTLNRISSKDGNQDVIIFQLLTAISSIGMDANTFVFTIKTLVTAIRYMFVCMYMYQGP